MQERKEKKGKEFFLSFLGQFGVLGVMMLLHRPTVKLGGLVGPAEMVGDAMASPTVGRLAYMAFAVLAFLVCTLLASRYARKGKDILPFYLGVAAGSFLWQVIGEDAWHFAVGGVHMVQLESIAALPIALLFILFLGYIGRKDCFDWGVTCVVYSFACNWLGHYVLEGSYAFAAPFVPETVWFRVVGILVGGGAFLYGCIRGLKLAKSTRGRMAAAILAYIGVGVLAFALMEG